MKNYNEAILAF